MIIDIFYGKMSFHRIEEELAFTFPDMIGKTVVMEICKKIMLGTNYQKEIAAFLRNILNPCSLLVYVFQCREGYISRVLGMA